MEIDKGFRILYRTCWIDLIYAINISPHLKDLYKRGYMACQEKSSVFLQNSRNLNYP